MYGILDEKDKKELRKQQIILLVTSYYNKFDFLHYESLDVLIDKSLELFLDSDLTLEEIDDKLIETIAERKKTLNERYDSEKVKVNHETFYGKLELLARELQKAGIDYQLAGALCGYIKYDQESDRCHDNINIFLNENDFQKFQEICSNLGLSFEDNRNRAHRQLVDGVPRGERVVVVKDQNSVFNIDIFPFERKEDGSVISKMYYQDLVGMPCIREDIYSPLLAHELFEDNEVDFRGTPLRITPPEQIYLLKKNSDDLKDQHDEKFLEDKIDHKKLMRIHSLSRDGINIRFVSVSNPSVNLPNSDELSSMLEEDFKTSKNNNSYSKEGVKMFVKKAEKEHQGTTSNSDGFITNAIITTLALITFVLCFIGIAIIYLVQLP